MAEVLLYRIEFIANSSGYVTGDIVDILVETDDVVLGDSDSGIIVKKNGVVAGSGGTIGIFSSDPPFVQSSYNSQVCVDGALLVFNRGIFFPYGFFSSLADHPSCAVAPETCDLIVVGAPVLTRPTSSTTADGSIQINATSSNTIQYKLGSDFEYGDGTGQTSNTFTTLLPGSYRVYLRDSNNCGASIFINLTVTNTYGVKYRGEYDDEIGGVTRIDILERGYVGAITEVCESGTPLRINKRGDGTTDKFEPIMALELVIELLSDTDQKFLTLYTNDREKYRVKTYKNDELKVYSKVLPQQYQEDYKAPPYIVTFSATCGLPVLKDYILVQDDGQILFGTISLIKLVAYCLSRIGLELPIRVACNMYATEMDQTDDDDPFDQAYTDFECFYLSGETPTLDYVMRSILEPFGAQIVQWDGRWNIVRVEEMVRPYDYRDFDSDGEYVTNGTFDPVIDLNFPSSMTGAVVFANADQNLEVKPGYGLFKVLYKLGLKPNILKNGDFRLKAVYNPETTQYTFDINKDGFLLVNGGYPIAELFERIDETNVAYLLQGGGPTIPETGSAYIKSDAYLMKMGTNNQLKITIRYKLPLHGFVAGNTVFYSDPPYIKVRLVIRLGSGYLSNDGTWSITPTEIVFYTKEYGKYLESEIVAQSPTGVLSGAATGLDFSVSVYQAYVFHADFTVLATFKAFDTLLLGEQTRRTFRTSTVASGTNSYIVNDNLPSYVNGAALIIRFTNGSTGASTLNVNSLGADIIYTLSVSVYSPIGSGDIISDHSYLLEYDTAAPGSGGWVLVKEIFADEFYRDKLLYYELENNTEAEDIPNIIRPDDYLDNPSLPNQHNPKQWVLKNKVSIVPNVNIDVQFWIDRIKVQFLTDGNDPIDTILRSKNGEELNVEVFEKELIIGSYSNLIVSETYLDTRFSFAVPGADPIKVTTVTNALSADTIYTGYLRDADGVGYETFARDGISESDKLHGIYLASRAVQYNAPWVLMRGSFYSNNVYFGPLNVIKETNADDRIFLPTSFTIDDKKNQYNGELLQLTDVLEAAGSDGGSGTPFSSGFSSGFGQSGFN